MITIIIDEELGTTLPYKKIPEFINHIINNEGIYPIGCSVIFDGIRIAVMKGNISKDNIDIKWFNPNINSLETLEIDEHGRLKHWPNQMFDLETEYLCTLMRI